MKQVGIITIYDNSNFGNRLQNYATQEAIKKIGAEPFTLKNLRRCNTKPNSLFDKLKLKVIFVMKIIQNNIRKSKKEKIFEEFNKKYINLGKNYITSNNAKKIEKKFDYFLVGSDQVWNPKFKRMTYIDLLGFTNKNKKSSFSASFGVSELNNVEKEKLKQYITDFKYISVRENEGKKILDEIVPEKNTQVLLDPTMLLDKSEWDRIIKKPICLNAKKYILLYFLGEIENEWKNEIDRVAKENDCDIINVLDKNSEFYNIGPDEFVYLEKNAFLICTDSFHSTVFAILYNKPFTIFERITKVTNLNSRVDTLLKKFNLESQKYSGKITLETKYDNVNEILNIERMKSIEFLKKACEDERQDEN